MKKKHVKTNAVRQLEKLGVGYELREYEVDESDLSGQTVAEKIDLPPEQVFKTLVARGTSGAVIIACVPCDSELDLKALAVAAHEKKMELVPVKDIQKLTGYIRGGVSPVATKKPYPGFIDESAENWPVISLSAGMRGCQMLVRPSDIMSAAGLQSAAIAVKHLS